MEESWSIPTVFAVSDDVGVVVVVVVGGWWMALLRNVRRADGWMDACMEGWMDFYCLSIWQVFLRYVMYQMWYHINDLTNNLKESPQLIH